MFPFLVLLLEEGNIGSPFPAQTNIKSCPIIACSALHGLFILYLELLNALQAEGVPRRNWGSLLGAYRYSNHMVIDDILRPGSIM